MAYQKSFTAQIWPMVAQVLESVESIYDGRVYSYVPPRNASYPSLVYQSQDLGGINDDTIGNNGWNGIVTLRSIDYTQSGAHNLLAQALHELTLDDYVVTNIPTLSGAYNVQIEPNKPITFPMEQLTEGTLYTAGIIVTVYISPVV